MWTPRRILIFLAGLAGCVAAYAGYTYFLGGIDGLPQLPDKFLLPADGKFDFDESGVPPTLRKLEQAFASFNPSCPEARDPTTYQIRLEMPQADDSRIVLATGPLDIWKDRPERVTVAPISMAVFGKTNPKAEPGQEVAIHTVHADRAVLEFDKPIQSPQDLNRNRLLSVELIGDPDTLSHDRRKGRVTITSNQGSKDPEQWLILRTPGPVYYTASPDPSKPPSLDVPQIRSTAPLVLENRANMPRPLRGRGLPVADDRGDDWQSGAAVRDVLLGTRTPPPTISADGFKIYLQPSEPTAGKPNQKGVQTGFSGLRKLELTDRVAVSLWAGGDERKVTADPSAAATGTVGVAADGVALARRLADRTLVTIETLGTFTYDAKRNAARFTIARNAGPTASNYVVVHRQSARGTSDTLVCDELDLEFDESLARTADSPSGSAPSSSAQPGFKSVLATGRQVLVTGDAEQFMAQGTELRYATDPKTGIGTTVLKGPTVTVVRDRNKMVAGTPARPAVVTATTTPPPKGSTGSGTTAVAIQGPGRVDLIEPGAKDPTGYAEWAESLSFDKARIGATEYDRLIFVRGEFRDTKGEFGLAGDLVHLFLEPTAGPGRSNPLASTTPAAAAKPVLLQAAGHVRGGSDQFEIERADALNVWFREGAPPKPNPVPVATDPSPLPGRAVAEPPAPVAAPVKQPPVHLSARKIDTWLVRTTDPAAKTTSYALELAHCVDRVEVHQAPADPKKAPRGLDVTAARLNLEGRADETGAPAGYFVTVDGEGDKLAEVHFEAVSLTGPKVVIDQPRNKAKVIGRGKLRMPTGSALTGAVPTQNIPGTLDVLWSEEMTFNGADQVAVFTGKVQAEHVDPFPTTVAPGEEPTEKRTWLTCHKLDVRFDRPVYFNQMKKPTDPADGGPKVSHVSCYPQADDDLIRAALPPGERVSFTEEVIKRDKSVVSAQRLTAALLVFRAKERETEVAATGPGEIRVLRVGAKDPAKAAPGATSAAADVEMKLTVVTFKSRLGIVDQGKKFQKATFFGPVDVFHVPGANLNLELAPHALPPRGLYLTCQDRMEVTSYQREGRPTEQQLLAVGEAEVRTDEYSGRGATITYDGRLVELAGMPPRILAYLYSTDKSGTTKPAMSGAKITYDRSTGERVKIDKWADGTFGK